jgi:hypothetical protein
MTKVQRREPKNSRGERGDGQKDSCDSAIGAKRDYEFFLPWHSI